MKIKALIVFFALLSSLVSQQDVQKHIKNQIDLTQQKNDNINNSIKQINSESDLKQKIVELKKNGLQIEPTQMPQIQFEKQKIQKIKQQPQIKYINIQNSSEYHRQFQLGVRNITNSKIYDVTEISNKKQICIDQKPCPFFYYEINSQSSHNQTQRSIKTVLLVSGMHGNQQIGPLTLLYGLNYLRGVRIIIFPLANPSGFDKRQRLTYPTNIDPNRDFPIQAYTLCYQSSSTLILDLIYRSFSIDLTFALHNGQSQIAWNWGTMRQTFSHTEDYLIYKDLAQMMTFYGGSNKKINMQQFKIGTMTEVVYPVMGSFDDWAYAASWYQHPLKKNTNQLCKYNSYPLNMTHGLVFLLQLGPQKVAQEVLGQQNGIKMEPNSGNLKNGYVSRAIRMISQTLKVVNPQLLIKFTNQKAFIRLQGCKNGEISNLKVYQSQKNTIYFQQQKQIKLKGSVNNFIVEPLKLELKQQLKNIEFDQKVQKSRKLQIKYDLKCDSQWLHKGKSSLSNQRRYNLNNKIQLSSRLNQTSTYFNTQQQAVKSFTFIIQQSTPYISFDTIVNNKQKLLFGIVIIIISIIGVIVIYVIIKELKKDLKKRKIQKIQKQLAELSSEDINTNIQLQQKNQTQQNQSIEQRNSQGVKYPYLCDTDKSMQDAHDNQQILQLQQFVKMYKKYQN